MGNLQVTSRKDQRQYWADKSVPYEFINVARFVDGFNSFHVGQNMQKDLAIPYDKSQSHPAALVHDKYALSKRELLRACFAREIILMKRHMTTYLAKVTQVSDPKPLCCRPGRRYFSVGIQII